MYIDYATIIIFLLKHDILLMKIKKGVVNNIQLLKRPIINLILIWCKNMTILIIVHFHELLLPITINSIIIIILLTIILLITKYKIQNKLYGSSYNSVY